MTKKWWQEAVFYEIYCKSFCDSNGDGIGDLKGVMSKLPMLKELGIDCIWFTPIYTSPQVDNGYDVADYYNIDPAYGTLEDFKELLDKAHSMGMKVIMDQVLNHSSDECVWFQESRKSKDNPYRNYYIWHPGKPDGSEPNNWGSRFREGNGSAWEFDPLTGEYYMHQYAIKMPELNWEYEPLRQEIYKMLRWWLDLGIDGFRLDVFTRLKKPEGFPDSTMAPNPVLDRNGFVVDGELLACVDGIHEILHDIWVNVFGPADCYVVGEGAGVHACNAAEYISESRQEVSSVYHFDMASRKRAPLTNAHFRKIEQSWADLYRNNCWGTQYLSNHDSQRQVSQHGDDGQYRVESAKLLATLLHTCPGSPYLYQGEEIGMVNVQFDSIEDYNCCYTLGDYRSMMENGVPHEEAIRRVGRQSRDNARTPYQWDDSENAGFTTGKPWMKVNPRYTEINLEADRKSPDSIFAYYQKLITMRKEHPAILDGHLEFVDNDDEQILMYTRSCARETLLIVANKSGEPATLPLPENLQGHSWKLELSNYTDTAAQPQNVTWRPWECAVYSLAF